MASTVDYTVDSDRATALVTLDRPDSLNTLNDRLIEELCDAIARAEADDEVRAIVLRGAGDEAFSAGYDITPAEERGGGRPRSVGR